MSPQHAGTPAWRPPITALGNGILFRAIVSLPDHMCERGRGLQERIVFFEAPNNQDPARQLARLLANAWCINTLAWYDDGHIYNVDSARNRLRGNGSYSFAEPDAGELRLLDTGCGGECTAAVGADRIHYARAADVDLFVPPRVAARLRELLDQVEAMYQAEPARRALTAEVTA